MLDALTLKLCALCWLSQFPRGLSSGCWQWSTPFVLPFLPCLPSLLPLAVFPVISPYYLYLNPCFWGTWTKANKRVRRIMSHVFKFLSSSSDSSSSLFSLPLPLTTKYLTPSLVHTERELWLSSIPDHILVFVIFVNVLVVTYFLVISQTWHGKENSNQDLENKPLAHWFQLCAFFLFIFNGEKNLLDEFRMSACSSFALTAAWAALPTDINCICNFPVSYFCMMISGLARIPGIWDQLVYILIYSGSVNLRGGLANISRTKINTECCDSQS